MRYEGEYYLSLQDFVENICQPGKNESYTSLYNEFCTILTSKYSYENNKCFKAESSDKARHILFRLDLVLEIFTTENIKRAIVAKAFSSQLNAILKKEYFITETTCCCCPKKLKKAVARACAFTEFVRQGDVELRRFNSLKPNIKFLICLDIEGIYIIFCNIFLTL